MTFTYTTRFNTQGILKEDANIMTFHLQTLAKHTLCLTSLSCLSSFIPHQTVSTTRTDTFICLVHRGIISIENIAKPLSFRGRKDKTGPDSGSASN